MGEAVGSVARSQLRAFLDRERESLSEHRDAIRGQSLFPPPKRAPRPTFLHGFLLPFSLIVATLRHPTLGRAYLRLTVVRALVVALFAVFAFSASDPERTKHHDGPVVKVVRTKKNKEAAAAPTTSDDGIHVHAPGVHVDIDKARNEKKVVVLGRDIPVIDDDEDEAEASKEKKESSGEHAAPDAAQARHPVLALLSSSWAWVLWFIGVLSATEGVVIFFSRRWDDWLGFYASSLAHVRPEDDEPKTPKIAFDVKWLVKKLKRRIRGYLVFTAGVPLLALFQLVPSIGSLLFPLAMTAWGWYWLGVFTAAKSAHAWVDDDVAPSPLLIRELRDRTEGIRWLSPVRLYARLWAWLTRELNSCASAFERNPTPFLGLALARAILSLPGLYLLARPVIPIAAGRLCAESDPSDRFSMQT